MDRHTNGQIALFISLVHTEDKNSYPKMSIEFTSEDDRSQPNPGQSLNSSLGVIQAIFCIETLIRSILSRLESVLDLTWWGITDLKSKFSAPNFLFCSIFVSP